MPLLSLFENTKHTKPNHQKQILRKNTSKKDDLEYIYDAMGNRIVKIVKPRNVIVGGSGFTEVSPTADWLYTYYTRDASGNILATYTDIKNNETPNQTEYSIYGSSRVGTQTYTAEELNEYSYTNTIQTTIETIKFRQNSVISINGVPFVGGNFSYNFQIGDEIVLNSGETFIIYSNLSTGYIKNVLYITCDIVKTIGTENISSNNTKGRKAYELSNHLGNVMVTVSDKRKGYDKVDANGNVVLDADDNPVYEDGIVDAYFADVISATDYYPFGSTMPGRTFSTPSYRFGFNGMEKDDEMKGSANSLDFGARIYDSRLGKWLARDPLFTKYPFATPYNFALNTPIQAKDPDGRLVIFVNGQRLLQGTGINDDGSRRRIYGYKGDGTTKQRGAIDNAADLNSVIKGNIVNYWGGFAKKYQNKVKDNNRIFVDGSRLFTSGADRGMEIGREQGRLLIEKIESGEIKYKAGETIKIAAHSQGAAVGAGMAEVLIEKGYNVEIYDAYAAQDAGDIVLPEGIGVSTEYFRKGDRVVQQLYDVLAGTTNNGHIQGIDKRIEMPEKSDNQKGHGIGTYEDDLFDSDGNETQLVDEVTIQRERTSDKGASDVKICFIGGTKIWAEKGLVNVEKLNIGDKVYSYNFIKNRVELKDVIFYEVKEASDLITVITSCSDTITSTLTHPYYVLNKKWIEANKLSIGDSLFSAENQTCTILEVFIEKHIFKNVYNFQVKNNQNYFITKRKLLVHNKSYIKEDEIFINDRLIKILK